MTDSSTRTTHVTAPKRPNWRWRVITLMIAVAVVVFMLSLVEWDAFRAVLARLSPMTLIAAFIVYVLLNLWRALRYIALLDRPDLPVMRVFPIALYHNFLVRLLPFKLGEVSYILLMRSRLQVSAEDGVSSLFASRLLELLVIVIVAAASLLLSGEIVPNQSGIALVLTVIVLISSVAGFYYAGRILRWLLRVLAGFAGERILQIIDAPVNKLATGFDRMSKPRIFLRALFWSLFTYGSSFAVNAILLAGAGVGVAWPTLVVLVSIGMFATAFPFNISGFGTVELSWAFGLTVLAGFSTGEAASIGLMLNGYQLLCAALSGLIGYAVVQIQHRADSSAP